MAELLPRLKLRLQQTGDANDGRLTGLLAEAEALVEDYTRTTDTIPEVLLERAVLDVAAGLWAADRAPSGRPNSALATGDTPLGPAPARDPLTPAYRLLGRWVAPL